MKAKTTVIDIPGGEPLATVDGDVVIFRAPGDDWMVAGEGDITFLLRSGYVFEIEVRRAKLLTGEGENGE